MHLVLAGRSPRGDAAAAPAAQTDAAAG